MKGKSLVVQLFTLGIAIIAAYGSLFSSNVQAWLGIVAFALTGLLNSPILSSGNWPKNWGPVMWINNIAGIAVMVLTQLGEKSLVDPALITYVITGINLLLFTFVKDYGTETSIVK